MAKDIQEDSINYRNYKTFKKKEDYFVKVTKGSKIVEFTDEHLKTHLKIFNHETRPEYFGALLKHGLEYVDTVLMSNDEINRVFSNQEALGVQKYRKGRNPKYVAIQASIDRGYDLREKPLQVVVDEEGIPIILFNGITTNEILGSFSNMQNRLVAVYKKNRYYNLADLILIGGNQNSLGHPSGIVNIDDIRVIVQGYLEAKGLKISKNATEKERNAFINDLEEVITFASGGLVSVEKRESRAFIIEIIQKQTGVESLRSVNSGKDVLEFLKNDGVLDYVDTDYMKWKCYSANMDKFYTSLNIHHKKLTEICSANDRNASDIRTNVIIHMGTPNPSKPVEDFFEKFLTFYREYLETEDFILNTYTHNSKKTGMVKLVGAFQQVQELDDVFPFGSIVSFEMIRDEYARRYPNAPLGQI